MRSGMTVVDYGYQAKRAPVTSWVLAHGAAAALIGCAAFWVVVGASLYFTL